MIIAGGGKIPFAYMLPISSVLNDIHKSLGVKVTIPSAVEIERILSRQRRKSRPHSTSTKKIIDTPNRVLDSSLPKSAKIPLSKFAADNGLKRDLRDRHRHSYQEGRSEKKSTRDTKYVGKRSTISDIKPERRSLPKAPQVNSDSLDMNVPKYRLSQLAICSPLSLTALFVNITRATNIVEQVSNGTKNISRQLRYETINVLVELNRSSKWIADYHEAPIKAADKKFLLHAFESIRLECEFIFNKCKTFQLLQSSRSRSSGSFGTVRDMFFRVWRTRQDSG